MILSLAGNLEKPLMSLYGTEWRERGYGICVSPVELSYGGGGGAESPNNSTARKAGCLSIIQKSHLI
jgi:hypothetical protein